MIKFLTKFLLLLALLSGGIWIFLYTLPVATPAFQIIDSKHAEFYSQIKKSWLPATPPHVIPYGSSLRTGAYGRLDFGSSKAMIRMEANTEADLVSGTYLRPYPRIILAHGYFLIKNKGEKMGISVPLSHKLTLRKGFIADLLSIFSSTLERGSFLYNVAPDLSLQVILAHRGSLEIRSLILKKRFVLYEGNKVGFSAGTGRVETAPLQEIEKIQMEESFQKIKMPETEKILTPVVLPTAASKPVLPSKIHDDESPLKGGLIIPLESAKTFNTKSSESKVLFKKDTNDEPYVEFHYEVPNPDSMSGISWTTGAQTINLSKFTMLRLQVHHAEGFPYPDNLRIEIKSGEKILRVLSSKTSAGGWHTLKFPIKLSSETPVSEFSLVFTHLKVGKAKKGGLRIRGFSAI